MYPSLETIKIANGVPQLLDYHSERLNRTNRELYGISTQIDLSDHLVIPSGLEARVQKCRVIYHGEISRIEFSRYHIRPVSSLRLVVDDTINYNYKSTARSRLDRLYDQRSQCDDILIVRDGLITDTWYANVALMRQGQWYTPHSPLLRGIKRAHLIDSGMLIPTDIYRIDIHEYEQISLINAMLDLGDVSIPVSEVH